MSTSPRSLRRSEEASSTSPSTWLALLPRCSCSCCRWTLWREPPSKTSGAPPAVSGQAAQTEASFIFTSLCLIVLFFLPWSYMWNNCQVLLWLLVAVLRRAASLASVLHYLLLSEFWPCNFKVPLSEVSSNKQTIMFANSLTSCEFKWRSQAAHYLVR